MSTGHNISLSLLGQRNGVGSRGYWRARWRGTEDEA